MGVAIRQGAAGGQKSCREASDVAQEGVSRAKWLQGGKELQLSGIEGLLQIIEEQSTEQKPQHRNGKDVIRPAGNPPRAVR